MMTRTVAVSSLLTASLLAEEKFPHFPSLEVALIWMDQTLDAKDDIRLASAILAYQKNPEAGIPYLNQLTNSRGNRRLSTIFKDRSFPKNAETLKLGGHDKELGHVHIDFLKIQNEWVLKDIWSCR